MHPVGPKVRSNISAVAPRFGSTKLAAAATRGVLTLAVLSTLLLIAARSTHAQTETVLYNFTRLPDPIQPFSGLTFDGSGNLYGTTYYGGPQNAGTVFELSPNGNGGWNESVLYSFCSEGGQSCTDGQRPDFAYLIFDSAGNLYGTTCFGGANGYGVVFELRSMGTSWNERVLYSFAGGTDGACPVNGLIMDPAGNLYGTTANSGGAYETVFKLNPSASGWTKKVIYTANPSGSITIAGLTMDAAGNIFGVTSSTVFELSPSGNGGWNSSVIYTFPGYLRDGVEPQGTPVLDQAGNLYGTTLAGGANNTGTVYKLTHGKNGWTEKRLYSFRGHKKDGNTPYGGIVFDRAGNIYGTTELGGGTSDDGTVFELVAPLGKGPYIEKILWSFTGTDGSHPVDSLILDSVGNLYGTTWVGGLSGNGVVFELTP